ncbi:erythromycin esterase family protein [Streptomyces europaeiscabiei]|uniref:erythromycin esterase family protein n=1 Tax=Streptomyces europaeiscabiei TaxID=146819 RepID=UPI0029A23CC7|nr:erythromycin esterase family protein [Streptomyces europaeiscabiei]MDX3834131.1 erythromycin esterase family protein [Streptomyces europaeiscabiei]MDX3847498.1 erythromycin esterase family protein [Streptomyces europaeiscabiei]
MSQDIRDFVIPSCDLLALGEPTHTEPAFPRLRNDLFARLVSQGFRSIALETDRVPALALNDHVWDGTGDFDEVMREGIAFGRGEMTPNRRLITWMREYNRTRPPEERLAFHGFDAEMENLSAPSPRRYLEHARAYLTRGEDLAPTLSLTSASVSAVDLASLAGDDDRWSRTEAVMDPAMSLGATAEAEALRCLADDLLTEFHARAPELIAATSRAEWFRAKTHLTAGLGLLRYHKQLAQPLEESVRISRLLATRDALMVDNLLDIRAIEAGRGPTLVFGHNLHLRRGLSHMRMRDLDLNWYGAGAILSPLIGERYAFFAGSLDPDEATPEGADGILHIDVPD